MNRLAITLCGLILAALPSATALADTYTYTYTGNGFTTTNNPYTTSDFVSGSFTVSAPLAPNLAISLITIDSAAFTDGVQTMSTLTGTTRSTNVAISTDSNGNIVSWNVVLHGNSGDSYLYTSNAWEYDGWNSVLYVGDGTENDNWRDGSGNFWFYSHASNSNDPGTWTVTDNPSLAATPEPSGLLLLATGAIGGLGAFRRRLIG